MTNQTAVAARYEVRRANIADADLILRAQRANQWELDQMTAEEVSRGLAYGHLEAFVLTSERSRMCLVARQEGHRAGVMCWYREGPPVGLWTEVNAGFEKVLDCLQAAGVSEIVCFVSKHNPRRDKLLRFYRKLGWELDMVRLRRSI